ncbi:hypothetical protein PR048_015840 [Dryococelus australis]|uniref:Uncharacterized protein n=1 Tax=Dryococelus australis TaxID=614101 RepID=A0ABQ9HI51_9NEOP|nr:hypothetical protein PR048_015840 [Dryococelus australis]
MPYPGIEPRAFRISHRDRWRTNRLRHGRSAGKTKASIGAGIEGRRKREIPEKTFPPTVSSGTIPTCESPVTRPGIEPGSPWWKASVLIAQPVRFKTSSEWTIIKELLVVVEVAKQLERLSPTKPRLVQFSIPGGVGPGFRTWRSCCTMPLVGGLSRGSPVSPALLNSDAAPHSTRSTLVGSQDLSPQSLPMCRPQQEHVRRGPVLRGSPGANISFYRIPQQPSLRLADSTREGKGGEGRKGMLGWESSEGNESPGPPFGAICHVADVRPAVSCGISTFDY